MSLFAVIWFLLSQGLIGLIIIIAILGYAIVLLSGFLAGMALMGPFGGFMVIGWLLR